MLATAILTSLLMLTNVALAQTGTTSTTTGSASATTATDAALTTDGQIAKVLLTVDEGEVDAAEIAIKKAKRKVVREFAKMMAKHHRENKNQTKGLVKFTDRDATELSKTLKENAKNMSKDLKKEVRDAFDGTYVQQQIDAHQKELDLLDTTLIPNAKSEDMKTHLQKTREKVASHLTAAQNLKAKIE